MTDWIFTFGISRAYHDKYVRVTAESCEAARHIMFKAHGQCWAFQYPLEEAKGMIEEGRLTELAHFTQNDGVVDWEFG